MSSDGRESAVRWFRQDPRVPADHVLADYVRWLDRQALAARTRTSYGPFDDCVGERGYTFRGSVPSTANSPLSPGR